MSGSDSESESRDFLLPLRWKKKRPGNQKFTIADGPTLTKILSANPRPQPEFQGKEYVRGIKTEDKHVFNCAEPNCSAYFTNETSLKIHKLKHIDKKITCSFCDLKFKTVEDRAKHLDKFHPDLERNRDANPLKCKKCGKISRDKKALWRHCRETHRDQPYPCPQCHFPFSSPDNLKVHLKYKHLPEDVPTRQFPCGICGRVYAHKNSLMSHIKINHRGEDGGSYRCVLCNVMYDNRVSYKRHMKRHVNPKFHPCKVCNVKFQNSSHYKRHLGSRRHKQLARRLGKTHQMNETKLDIKILKEMEVCREQNPKSLTNEELIASCKIKVIKIILHRVDHTTIRNPSNHHTPSSERRKGFYLNCIYCDLSFSDLEATKTHEAICLMKIKNKKLHICPQCNKEFDNKHKLKMHSKTHTDDRPYQCSYCDANFKSHSTKIQHEKAVHFGIRWRPKVFRVFNCNHNGCDRRYSTPKALKRHVQSAHLGIRFPCETCGQIFKRAETLRLHVKDDHAKNPTLLLCRACKRAYKSKAALLSHFKTKRHHRKTKELCRQFGNKEEMTEVLSQEDRSVPVALRTDQV